MKSQIDKFIDACNAEDGIEPIGELSCFDCINWHGWKCEGKCIPCVDFSEFEPKE